MVSARINSKPASEDGFTLIELLVVIVIIGILLAIAVPSYIGFRDRATDSAAQANIRSAIPSAEAYYADNGTYATMTTTLMRSTYDSGLSSAVSISGTNTATKYCLKATGSGTKIYYFPGPGGPIFQGTSATKPAGWTC